jgi:hypothetical protein
VILKNFFIADCFGLEKSLIMDQFLDKENETKFQIQDRVKKMIKVRHIWPHPKS